MAIYITGDTHGEFKRFQNPDFYEQEGLTKQDYLIICGDFGGVWDGSPYEQYELDQLEANPYTTLFVSGNHENFDLLATYPVEPWHGGSVQRIRPSVIHLMRGQVYDIQGKTFFTMGGASSHDINGGILEPDDPLFSRKLRQLNASGAFYRIHHRSWWPEELPSPAEYDTARANLDQHGWNVDYIITHCCPSSLQAELSGGLYQADALTDFLDEVAQRCRFQCWFFGHYHQNRAFHQKYALLYEQVVQLTPQN